MKYCLYLCEVLYCSMEMFFGCRFKIIHLIYNLETVQSCLGSFYQNTILILMQINYIVKEVYFVYFAFLKDNNILTVVCKW